MESGKKCPMDAEAQTLATFQPGSTPTYHLDDLGGGNVDALRFNNSELTDSTEFHVSHFATCPNASQHSKK